MPVVTAMMILGFAGILWHLSGTSPPAKNDIVLSSSNSNNKGMSVARDNSNNNADNNQPLLPDTYKLCRITPAPIIGGRPVGVNYRGMAVDYQCGGTPYDKFMQKVSDLVLEKGRESPESKWGRREYIIPPLHNDTSSIDTTDSMNNGVDEHTELAAIKTKTTTTTTTAKRRKRKILIIGNSHTRQMVTALMCQYRDQIVARHQLKNARDIKKDGNQDKNMAHVYYMPEHELTLYILINHPLVYSHSWKATLEIDVLEFPLQELDGIVLGGFNRHHADTRSSNGALSKVPDSNFAVMAREYQQRYPQQEVNFENIAPPSIQDVAKVYSGPLVWVSMFAGHGRNEHQEALEQIGFVTLTHNRTNLRSVNGRNYIEALGGDECSSNNKVGGDAVVSTCVTDRSDPVYENGHRCTGVNGGQSDLVAWDVVEALHDIL